MTVALDPVDAAVEVVVDLTVVVVAIGLTVVAVVVVAGTASVIVLVDDLAGKLFD